MKKLIQFKKYSFCNIEYPILRNYINGELVESKSNIFRKVIIPHTNEQILRVPESTDDEIESSIISAKNAFITWKNTNLSERKKIFMNFSNNIRKKGMKFANIINYEQGKSINESKAEIFRALEILEYSCNISSDLMGETYENIQENIDIQTHKVPLGVCLGITPFNFPFLIPFWMFPFSIMSGNTFILKPSEYVPSVTLLIASTLEESGLPKGVFNIIQGGGEIGRKLCLHKDIKAISFAGRSETGKIINEIASKSGKRVQIGMSSKNHCVITPSSNKIDTINSIISAAFGSTGQRCMSLSVAIFIGKTREYINDIVKISKRMKFGYDEKNLNLIGPLTKKDTLERIHKVMSLTEEEGGKILLDGRWIDVPGYNQGNWIGPCIIGNVNTNMTCYNEELLGPVLLCMEASDLDEAIDIINRNKNGNGCVIFTESGSEARKFQREAECGLVGINVPSPVPSSMFSFSSNKESFYGNYNFFGKSGVNFYNQTKTVISKWK